MQAISLIFPADGRHDLTQCRNPHGLGEMGLKSGIQGTQAILFTGIGRQGDRWRHRQLPLLFNSPPKPYEIQTIHLGHADITDDDIEFFDRE